MLRTMLVVMLAFAGTQSSRQAYLGQWTAQFGGATYVRLQLTESNGTVGGRISLGNIELTPHGELRRAEEAPSTLAPLFDVVLRDTMLTFARKDVEDTDRFEMRLLKGNAAELTFVITDEFRRELAAEGLPIPKPFPLTRASSPLQLIRP